MCTFQVPLAFLAISVNRLCSIVYHTKVFFKRKQWISGIIFSMPRIPFSDRVIQVEKRTQLSFFIFLLIGM
jgi:hypothetical protein